MLRIESIEEGAALYKALSSEMRLQILSLLAEYKELNMNELSEKLQIPNSTLTGHIRLLDECGLVEVRATDAARGMQKLCTLKESRLLLDLYESPRKHNRIRADIPPGLFSDYRVAAPCGLAAPDGMVGEEDNPVYFDAPERPDSSLVWFWGGYVEYPLPNYLEPGTRMTELQISMEIMSSRPADTPGAAPGGVAFSINGINLGSWQVPLSEENFHGIYTPSWWAPERIQSGRIKLLTINQKGTFIDGNNLVSGVTLDRLQLAPGRRILLRISSSGGGGIMLFGKGFGNYNQGITARMLYETLPPLK